MPAFAKVGLMVDLVEETSSAIALLRGGFPLVHGAVDMAVWFLCEVSFKGRAEGKRDDYGSCVGVR